MRLFVYMAAFCGLVGTPALASTDARFDQDRALAQQSMTPDLQQRCLEDFTRKNGNRLPISTSGNFAFNDMISRAVYQELYWGQAERGVAFTVPVHAADPKRGELAGTLGCFYGVSDNGLTFQQSQQVTWRLF